MLVHEFAHIRNRDIPLSSTAVTLADAGLLKLFQTDPPIGERTARLEAMSRIGVPDVAAGA